MSTPQAAAQRLAGTALAPPGSQLVLAAWILTDEQFQAKKMQILGL